MPKFNINHNRKPHGCWSFNLFFVLLQVQNLLKRLETPYSDDGEVDTASLSQKATSDMHRYPALFNISDGLDKPPDDALNMRLT